MTDPALEATVERACEGIAPTWPLDRFIAVNPFWQRTGKPLPQVAGDLAALSGAHLLMPRAWYAEEWRSGRLQSVHVREAIADSGVDVTEDDLLASFWIREPTSSRRPLVVDVLEALRRRETEHSWREFVMERISRFCASYFDDGQAQVGGFHEGGLYKSWRAQARSDPGLFVELAGYRSTLRELPATADEMISRGCVDLGVPAEQHERYFSALLLDVNGWASWCAYVRWNARLADKEDHHIRELLAIRLAWEWILLKSSDQAITADWRFAMASWAAIDRAAQMARYEDWILQRAVELAWLSDVRPKLVQGFQATRPATPKVQAVFCLDVRAEVFRRALEAQDPGVQTFGAAGFFGVPIEYAQLAAEHGRPQLPGLLAPKFRVTDTNVPEGLEKSRRARLQAANAWKAFKSSSLSSFAFVDSMGFFFARDLYRDAFSNSVRRSDHHDHAGLSRDEDEARLPRITSHAGGAPVTPDELCQLAEAFLRTIGLTSDFARVVLFIGHGSESRNNPHAAGLDCGACCGQPGDVNARAAAALFNDEKVRAGLAARGITIPATTIFVGGLHNTTTDDVALFVDGTIPETHQADFDEVKGLLEKASVATRRERAPRLGLDSLSDAKLHDAVTKRARNWAEVRPEWGLVGNAAFVVAPRERSRHINFEGRVFLHDYRSENDAGDAILEAIMTGPLVVAHWINFQYYASTVDNTRYGCGDKVLHNIVGGHLGVLEGNGGDLRIGLSLQSLHDGDRWVHAPLRLAAFIEAPREAIDRVLEKHAKVRELVDNDWLHLFQLDATTRAVFARRRGEWAAHSVEERIPVAT
jgi:uncharacterized protein YbcC (UPF0753/DUF2309 family)